jgi:CRISPR locus-related DNA-binding protein
MMELEKKLNVKLERFEVPLVDLIEAVLHIKEILKTVKEGNVRLAITGGMRALGLALFIVYLFTDWMKEPRVEVYLEGRGMALEVPSIRRLFSIELSESHLEVLRLMKPGVAYASTDLSGLLRKDRSTIYRHLQALVYRGLLERTPEGFKLSKLGLLLR